MPKLPDQPEGLCYQQMSRVCCSRVSTESRTSLTKLVSRVPTSVFRSIETTQQQAEILDQLSAGGSHQGQRGKGA